MSLGVEAGRFDPTEVHPKIRGMSPELYDVRVGNDRAAFQTAFYHSLGSPGLYIGTKGGLVIKGREENRSVLTTGLVITLPNLLDPQVVNVHQVVETALFSGVAPFQQVWMVKETNFYTLGEFFDETAMFVGGPVFIQVGKGKVLIAGREDLKNPDILQGIEGFLREKKVNLDRV